MPNVPPEYEGVITAAVEEMRKHSKQRRPSQVLKEVYGALVDEFIKAGAPPEGFNPAHTYYVALQMTRVVGHVQTIAKSNPPTHRKGMGKDGGIVRLNNEDWIFLFEGVEGEGFDPSDPDGDGDPGDSGTFEWASQSEQDRAFNMMEIVAADMGFGPDDEPLPFIREVARRLGGRWGLNGKRGNATDLSSDVLAWDIPGYPPQLFDVLIDSGGENTLTWQRLRYGQAAVWIAP